MSSRVSELSKITINLTVALIRHRLKTLIGDEVLEIAANEFLTLGGQKVAGNIMSVLSSVEGSKRLLRVGERSDMCFKSKIKGRDLQELEEVFTLSFGDLPTVQEAIVEFPEHLDVSSLKDTFQQTLQRDFKTIDASKIDEGFEIYYECLLRELVQIEDYASKIIVSTLLDIEKKVDELSQEQKEGFDKIENLLLKLNDFTKIIHRETFFNGSVKKIWLLLSQKETWPNSYPVTNPVQKFLRKILEVEKQNLLNIGVPEYKGLEAKDFVPQEKGFIKLNLLIAFRTFYKRSEYIPLTSVKLETGFFGYRIYIDFFLTALNDDLTKLEWVVGADGYGIENDRIRSILNKVYGLAISTAIEELREQMDN